jgi:hypothetical protein
MVKLIIETGLCGESRKVELQTIHHGRALNKVSIYSVVSR